MHAIRGGPSCRLLLPTAPDLRVDQIIQLLRPVLIQVLQDVVLLQGRVAIAHRQVTIYPDCSRLCRNPASIESPVENDSCASGILAQLQIGFAHVVGRFASPGFRAAICLNVSIASGYFFDFMYREPSRS